MIKEKDLKKHFGNLEDHEYRHYNRSLGVQVESKEHYLHLLNKGGYVPIDESRRLTEDYKRKNPGKKYNGVSEETRKFIADIKSTASRDGKIRPTEQMVNKMKKLGVKFEMYGDPNKIKQGGMY